MRKHRPEWVQDVHVVPESEVKQVLRPSEAIPRLVNSDSHVREIVKALDLAGIPRTSMGVTGSMLAGLQNESSDIDFVAYGPLWFRARDAITTAKQQEGQIEEIDEEMWQRIYNKRIPEISFDEFMLHESRKGNRGMVEGTYFDLLFVREWDQIKEPLLRGKDTVKMKIEARVTNADFAFDSPAYYRVEHEEIDHVLSYTHTYAGQALPGELIEARGIVEEVGDIKRLVVGTSREPKGEWIRSLTWLEQCGYI
jgi:predicted nucleotidyltransferase